MCSGTYSQLNLSRNRKTVAPTIRLPAGIELVPELIDSYDSLYNLLNSRRREIAASVFTEGENLFESPALTWHVKNTRIDLVCKNGAIMRASSAKEYARELPTGSGMNTACNYWSERYWLPPGSKTHGPISITWQKVNWRLSPPAWSRPIPLKTGEMTVIRTGW